MLSGLFDLRGCWTKDRSLFGLIEAWPEERLHEEIFN